MRRKLERKEGQLAELTSALTLALTQLDEAALLSRCDSTDRTD